MPKERGKLQGKVRLEGPLNTERSTNQVDLGMAGIALMRVRRVRHFRQRTLLLRWQRQEKWPVLGR